MKRKHKASPRKLKLDTETLHTLDRKELDAVQGGGTIVGTVTAGCAGAEAD